mgnify:CR=1 FL=1
MKIAHISDIHWRGLTRHSEYRESFSDCFEKLRQLSPDVIYIGGDIVHSKTQGISPELIDCLSWWFTQMADICPTHVILGNHDGLMLNKDRQDAISPIVDALNNPQLYLYKKSGVYPTGIEGFNWCVFSCFDEENWENVAPVSGETNIALFHGGVLGSLTDIEWEIEGEVTSDFFASFDYSLLGDIHRTQFLTKDKKIAYSGSAIQQNYGEDPGKGFLFWDIRGKDDFDVSFHEIYHSKPFITLGWNGNVSDLVDQSNQYCDGARFRIKANEIITQADIKKIHETLKRNKSATEVVFKVDAKVDVSEISSGNKKISKKNLRDTGVLQHLFRTYYGNSQVSKEEWGQLDDMIVRYVSQIDENEEVLRNIRWSIKDLEFDNLFAYGKGNRINFENLSGITGIFGKNRTGKSSIIGSIMYTLFNTTDRGPIKNIHIINSRKGSCLGKMKIEVNGKPYTITRKTKKNQTRKGDVYASTSLDLEMSNRDSNDIVNLTEEQRRETERVLRRLVGISDDFLLTSLASQGEMNSFIKQGSSARRATLSKFLDLELFDKMSTLAKEESGDLRAELKTFSQSDWDTSISAIVSSLKQKRRDIAETEEEIISLREKIQKIRMELATDSQTYVTSGDINRQESKVLKIEKNLHTLETEMFELESQKDSLDDNLQKISQIKDQFPIDDLRRDLEKKRELEKSFASLERDYKDQKRVLSEQKDSVRILEEVPCGEKFPTCKFIKNSHKDQDKISNQEEIVSRYFENVKKAKNMLDPLVEQSIEAQVEKYSLLLGKENTALRQSSDLKVKIHSCELMIEDATRSYEIENKRFLEMKSLFSENEPDNAIRSHMEEMVSRVETLDRKKMSFSEKAGKMKVEIEILKREKARFEEIRKKLRVYEMFISASSKKGIPLSIMIDQIPAINSEISKILQGVTGFTVELEVDDKLSSMDAYIDYGDSRRVIELASGMEKMMASLAIRVALINISSLPKTDMLIIDEGFGSLDDSNIEACNQLLSSLKRWFRNILIISHVDAVKDFVDDVLDITKLDKDSRVFYE